MLNEFEPCSSRLCSGNSLITQIIDLQTLFAINDRQTGQTDRQDRQTDRQVAFKGRDYSRKYLKMHLMVGEAEGVLPGHV